PQPIRRREHTRIPAIGSDSLRRLGRRGLQLVECVILRVGQLQNLLNALGWPIVQRARSVATTIYRTVCIVHGKACGGGASRCTRQSETSADRIGNDIKTVTAQSS